MVKGSLLYKSIVLAKYQLLLIVLMLDYRFLLSTSMVTIPANNDDNIIMMITNTTTMTVIDTDSESDAFGLANN